MSKNYILPTTTFIVQLYQDLAGLEEANFDLQEMVSVALQCCVVPPNEPVDARNQLMVQYLNSIELTNTDRSILHDKMNVLTQEIIHMLQRMGVNPQYGMTITVFAWLKYDVVVTITGTPEHDQVSNLKN